MNEMIHLSEVKSLLDFVLDKFRNGVETKTQLYTPNKTSDAAGKAADVQRTRRLHESWNHYDRCYNRERNKGEINEIIFYRSMNDLF